MVCPRTPLSATINDENENKWHLPKMEKDFLGIWGNCQKFTAKQVLHSILFRHISNNDNHSKV